MDQDSKPFKPSPKDAFNVSTLRYYAMTIEQLYLAAYFSDLEEHRPNLQRLKNVIRAHITHVRKEFGPPHRNSRDCPDEYELCPDGLCHPPDTCSK